jgi:hypothetical protein
MINLNKTYMKKGTKSVVKAAKKPVAKKAMPKGMAMKKMKSC